MKFLVLVFLAVLALTTAIPFPSKNVAIYNELENLEDEFIYQAEDEPKTELGKELVNKFHEILEKIKAGYENGKGIKEETLEKLKELREQMKDLKIGVGKHARELLEKIKEGAKVFWKKILDKLNPDEKALFAEGDSISELGQKLQDDFDDEVLNLEDALEVGMAIHVFYRRMEKMREIHEKLRKMNLDISDYAKDMLEKLKDQVRSFYQKVFDRTFQSPQTRQNGVINDYFHKVKDFFGGLNIELHEKFAQFGHWIKEQYEVKLEKGKDKAESLKQIAKEFLKDSRTMSKHMAVEAKFFFNEYSHEIGDLFGDVMKKIGKVLES